MVGSWHRRKTCHARTSPRAVLPSSRIEISRKMSSNRTRISSWRTWQTPLVCAWVALTEWHSTVSWMATVNAGKFVRPSCVGICQPNLRSRSTSCKGTLNRHCWKPSCRRSCCSSQQVCRCGPPVLALQQLRSRRPALWWQIVGIVDASWPRLGRVMTSPLTTTLKVRRRKRFGECSLLVAPSLQTNALRRRPLRGVSRRRAHWVTIGQSHRDLQKATSYLECQRSEQ
mmetsp:Transcript_6343/g.14542  ORF Transcript_6343/g.14542 Transcript_6343/m.14542 type:complete len:228 (-) Transcript_6343:1265-1948(-)